MATGYTAQIGEGITFEAFILSCARNFGALISMRDAPGDAEIPGEFKPSSYHKEQLQEAEVELKSLRNITVGEANEKAKHEYQKMLVDNEKAVRNGNILEGKYRKMLTKVKAWKPPTPDHKGLKDFMVSQIEDSIKWDCDTEYYISNIPPIKSGEEWLRDKLQSCLEDVNYHTK